MLIGYVRVSTKEQNETRQVLLLQEKGIDIDNIFIDKQSGKTADREALKNMLSFIRKGDTVIVESISRIARNTRDLLNIVDELNNKQVDFISLKENIDTGSPTGKFMLTVFGAMAELEREYILDRQAEGIEIAKAEGKFKGKPKTEYDKEEFTRIAKMWRNKEITGVEAMKRLNVKKNTFYRRVAEWGL